MFMTRRLLAVRKKTGTVIYFIDVEVYYCNSVVSPNSGIVILLNPCVSKYFL